MNVFKAVLDTRQQNAVIGTITQFDNATLELQVLTDGVIDEDWGNPRFELIAMKRDMNSVREVDQDKFTILSKEDHKVQIELKEQFLTYRGSVKMQLVIKDGGRLSTTLFYLVIAQSLDHDIVESHRDVAVLDELEAYIKQGFDDLAYQEQRMAAVEQSTNDLNETMNANEAERNAAETKRSQIFETNETNRARTFNNQVEEQGVAFSNAQTQRDESFIESQQNMSQEFETSQRERENAFNELQKSNQKTFETNEQKRQTAFNQSQTANQQDFVDNEAERQRLFETNESSRQKSESQRVKNESERVFAETQRADAEVIRQQKMTEFEEKATQLSEDLDNQVARVDKFVAANEEKLLGPHDKTDYMGNAHKSVKDANDANVEYILGEVNTVHYEGQHITATDTIEKQVRSAILKGNTLVNLSPFTNKIALSPSNISETKKVLQTLNQNTKYILIFNINNSTSSLASNYIMVRGYNTDGAFKEYGRTIKNFGNGKHYILLESMEGNVELIFIGSDFSCEIDDTILAIYQDGMENWDIPYFEGMQSVRMPVLTTTGKNLFELPQSDKMLKGSIGKYIKLNLKPNTNYTYNSILDKKGNTSEFDFYGWISNDINSNFTGHKVFHWKLNKTFSKTFNTGNDEWYFHVYGEQKSDDYRNYLINFQLEEGSTATSHEPYKSNILSTSEDVVLRGIGEVRDTLDCLTGEVVQNIGEMVLDGSENWVKPVSQPEITSKFMLLDFPNNPTAKILSNFKVKNSALADSMGIWCDTNTVLNVDKSIDTVEQLKAFLFANNITIQITKKQESIKTVDLNGQKVYSYDGTTHYSCSAAEGSLIPTLAIDVPTNLPALVSRQRATIESQKEQIITLEQENEQLIAQNEVQDIDISLNQDAINFMLFAPATMSVNDESKNSKGANTMAAYLANQILKGKLDYALVVGRYGSYKEDIDTILIAEGKQDLIK